MRVIVVAFLYLGLSACNTDQVNTKSVNVGRIEFSQGSTGNVQGEKTNIWSSEKVRLDIEKFGFKKSMAETYRWRQVHGKVVELVDANYANAFFIAPQVSEKSTLIFELSIMGEDGKTHSYKKSVEVSPISTVAKLNFSDKNFGRCVINTGRTRIDEIRQLHCTGMNISNMRELGYFTHLKKLEASSNVLSNINLTETPYLEYVDISYNQISSIVLKENQQLTYLNALGNRLSLLDVYLLPNLTTLVLSKNTIKSIDIQNNLKLENLYLDNNRLDVISVRKNVELKFLKIDKNRLSLLDVQRNPKLEYLFIDGNHISCREIRTIKRHLPKISGDINIVNCEIL